MNQANQAAAPVRSRLARALWFSGGVAAYLLAVRFAAWPLHARGWAQPVLAGFNALGYVLAFPGYVTAGLVNRRAIDGIDGLHWWLSLLCNFILYTVGLFVVNGLKTRYGRNLRFAICDLRLNWNLKSQISNPRISDHRSPISASRRQFIRKSARIAAGSALGSALGYSLLVEPRRLCVTARTFAIRDLPPSLDRLRLAQVSDLHHGPWLSLDYVRHVVLQTNALEPDLILLTGDYVYESPRYIDPAIAALAELRAKIGIVGVLGNHDWWDNGRPMRDAFGRFGLPLIDNARLILTPAGKLVRDAADGLCLAGVGDYWEDRPDYHSALANLPPAMPRLLLAHNPDCAEDPAFTRSGYRVDLMISGHTHGGQVWVPGFGTPILPSRYGQKYAAGLVQGPMCPVFISRGIGVSGLPLRFGVPPEIVVMELRRA